MYQSPTILNREMFPSLITTLKACMILASDFISYVGKQSVVAMISTKFIRFSFDKLARTHKIARSFSPRVLVPKPVPTGSAYVTHAPQEPHFGSDTLPLFDARKWSKYNHTAPCLYNSNSFKAF